MNVDQFWEKQWGLFVHYLPGGDRFQDLIAGFDAPRLAQQPAELKAGY